MSTVRLLAHVHKHRQNMIIIKIEQKKTAQSFECFYVFILLQAHINNRFYGVVVRVRVGG